MREQAEHEIGLHCCFAVDWCRESVGRRCHRGPRRQSGSPSRSSLCSSPALCRDEGGHSSRVRHMTAVRLCKTSMHSLSLKFDVRQTGSNTVELSCPVTASLPSKVVDAAVSADSRMPPTAAQQYRVISGILGKERRRCSATLMTFSGSGSSCAHRTFCIVRAGDSERHPLTNLRRDCHPAEEGCSPCSVCTNPGSRPTSR